MSFPTFSLVFAARWNSSPKLNDILTRAFAYPRSEVSLILASPRFVIRGIYATCVKTFVDLPGAKAANLTTGKRTRAHFNREVKSNFERKSLRALTRVESFRFPVLFREILYTTALGVFVLSPKILRVKIERARARTIGERMQSDACTLSFCRYPKLTQLQRNR